MTKSRKSESVVDPIKSILKHRVWTNLYLDFLDFLPFDAAVLFSDFVNATTYKEAWESDWWFMYTGKEMAKRLRMNVNVQTRLMKKLVEMDLIEVELRGIPPRRWIKINYVELRRRLKEFDDARNIVTTETGAGYVDLDHVDCRINTTSYYNSSKSIYCNSNTTSSCDSNTTSSCDSNTSLNTKELIERNTSNNCRTNGKRGKSPKRDSLHIAPVVPIAATRRNGGAGNDNDIPPDVVNTNGDDMAGFIPELEEVRTGPVSPFDMKMAERLKNIIQTKSNISLKVSVKSWASRIRLLRKDVGGSEPRIEKVMDWYENNHGKPYVPTITSAIAFRSKFIKIESSMQRVYEGSASDPSSITPDAQKVIDRLRGLKWPKDSGRQLPAAVQSSVDAHAMLWQLKKANLENVTDDVIADKIGDPKKVRRIRKFADFMFSRLGGRFSFVETWFRDIHEQVRNWDEWSGNLKAKSFSATSKEFKKRGQGWAVEYGCPDSFDLLMKVLIGE